MKKYLYLFFYESHKIVNYAFSLALLISAIIKMFYFKDEELPHLLSYFFWLSLGIWLGYQLCYSAFMYLRSHDKNGNKVKDKKPLNGGFSIN